MEAIIKSVSEKYEIILDYFEALPSAVKIMNNSDYFFISNISIFQVSTKTLEIKLKIDNPLSLIDFLDISSDDNYLAGGNYKGQIIIFNILNQKRFFELPADYLGLRTIKFLEDCERILLAHQESSIDVWDFKRGVKLSTLLYPDIIVNFVISHSEQVYIVGAYSLEISDLNCEEISESIPNSTEIFVIGKTSDDTTFIIGDEFGNVFTYKPGTMHLERLEDAKHNNWVYVIAVSHNDKFAATGGLCRFIFIWEIETRRLRMQLDRDKSCETTFLIFSEDSTKIFSSFKNIYFAVWDISDGHMRIIGQHERTIRKGEISKDFRVIVTASDEQVLVWNAKEFCLIRQICGHSRRVKSVLDLEGIGMIVSTDDRSIKFWDSKEKVDRVTINISVETKKVIRYKDRFILAFADTKVVVAFLTGLDFSKN